MLKKLYYFVLNSLLTISYIKHELIFRYSLSNVEKVQRRLLLIILNNNKETKFGIKHKFSSIREIRDFQRKVSITTYDDYQNYIKLICDAKPCVLTEENIKLLEPTSGSTARSKLIPYTESLKKEFQKGIGPWIFDIYTKRSKLLAGNSYWSITPLTRKTMLKKSKIPIGFDDDTSYFGFFQKFLLNATLAVPNELKNIKDIDSFRYVTLLFLLKNKHISFISIWNPTYINFFLNNLERDIGDLILDIETGEVSYKIKLDSKLRRIITRKLSKDKKRADELREIFNKQRIVKHSKGESIYEQIWPNLSLISCWDSGNSAHYINEIKRYFPNVEIQGKGLIATEGFVSLPRFNLQFPALSINSHFFEFIDKENNNIKLAHELETGKVYSVIITTGGGLYRYNLNDLVGVKGFYNTTPLIEFLSKEDDISDLFGEKINEEHVNHIFDKLFRKYRIEANFFMLAPEKDKSGKISYVVYLELKNILKDSLLLSFSKDFEKNLRKNFHYDYCRKLGQLQNLRLFLITSKGLECFLKLNQEKGQRLGNVKILAINKNFNWSRKFNGIFVT